ncbi:type VI secretion system tube protein Hcp [Variovorax sp. UC122_21]|uniref:type VI secretion system tube protein Hcp n=1 Tax=Variovorax TaxID=34072 RepID=UPI0019327BBE|nr:type VI secretion system tube protein Hcp [Variovorax paradoxus]
MSFSAEGALDPDELLRLLDLMAGEPANDFLMSIDNRGTKVKGESERGIEFIDIGGYCHQMEVVSPPGSTKGSVRVHPFVIVREVDAATASIASLLFSQEANLEVSIFVYRASGDHLPSQPFFEVILTGARVVSQAIVTGGKPRQPREVTVFESRNVQVKTAPQLASGIRGAVRTAVIAATQ